MKKVRFLILLVSWFSLFLSPSLLAGDSLTEIVKRGVLRVGLEAGYMPFEMKDKKGKIVGFDVDLAKLMAREMGVKLELVNTEWDGIIPALLTGKFDMIIAGMTITQKRNLRVNFSDPYMIVGQTIILKKSLAGVIKSYKDLNSKKYKISSKLGTTGEKAIKRLMPRAVYKSYQTSQEAAMEVINGRVDAFVYDLPYSAIFASSQGQGKIHFLKEPFTFEPLAIAVKRGDPDILNWLNHFLHQIKKDGRYDKMYKRWFVDSSWRSKIQ